MISNSSPPRTAPLTTLNNSPFSRGARAVYQGQKKAKAYNFSIAEPECEKNSGQSIDGNNVTNGIGSLGDISPNGDLSALTPISKGILKRKREAERRFKDDGTASSKKKVIFADPISATKLIESRIINVKTNRKRRLRYEEPTEETENGENGPKLVNMSECDSEMVKETETESKDVIETVSKVRRLLTLKVIMPTLPLELSSKINVDKPSANDDLRCPGTKIESPQEESMEIERDSEKSKEIATSTDQDLSKEVETPATVETPKSTESNPNESTTEDNPPATEFKESTLIEEEEENSPKQDYHEKDCVITSKKIELNLKCKSGSDPDSIVPRASIVLKKLTEEEMLQLLKPKITIPMEISKEVDPIEDNNEVLSKNKMIDEETLKSSSSLPPTEKAKEDGLKSSLSIEGDSLKADEPTPLRKSRRKRDSVISASQLLAPVTRTRRRTISVKIG